MKTDRNFELIYQKLLGKLSNVNMTQFIEKWFGASKPSEADEASGLE